MEYGLLVSSTSGTDPDPGVEQDVELSTTPWESSRHLVEEMLPKGLREVLLDIGSRKHDMSSDSIVGDTPEYAELVELIMSLTRPEQSRGCHSQRWEEEECQEVIGVLNEAVAVSRNDSHLASDVLRTMKDEFF